MGLSPYVSLPLKIGIRAVLFFDLVRAGPGCPCRLNPHSGEN